MFPRLPVAKPYLSPALLLSVENALGGEQTGAGVDFELALKWLGDAVHNLLIDAFVRVHRLHRRLDRSERFDRQLG